MSARHLCGRVSSFQCTCQSGYTGERCELLRFQPLAFSLGADIFQLANDVSADGTTVVGVALSRSNVTRSFRWSPAAGLEDLSATVPFPQASLSGANRNGSVLVGIGNQSAFRWPIGEMATVLPRPSGYTSCTDPKVSADGATVAGSCYNPASSSYVAVRWTLNGSQVPTEVLPVPANTLGAVSKGISGDGALVVASVLVSSEDKPAGEYKAARWSRTGLELLDPGASGMTNLIPQGTSGDGRVVIGFGSRAPSGASGFRWTPATGTEQLALPSASASTLALDVNDAGSVIVGVVRDAVPSEPGEALLWDIAGVHFIRDLLLAAGVDSSALAGWKMGEARAVSANGKVIFGTGINPAGFGQTWIARLP